MRTAPHREEEFLLADPGPHRGAVINVGRGSNGIPQAPLPLGRDADRGYSCDVLRTRLDPSASPCRSPRALSGMLRAGQGILWLVVLLGLRGLLVAAPARADSKDQTAGSRRLRQLADNLKPLADTTPGITRDVGSIAVIEHDGSNYDKDQTDGTPNYAPRASVAQRFYQSHGDFYDFLVVFTNFEFNTAAGGGDALAFHNFVRNDIRGIGKPIADDGSLFGSPGRLKAYVDMAALSRYRDPPQSLEAGDPGFIYTLNVLAHEVAHQWLAEVHYRDPRGQSSSALLGRDGAHWSYLLDSDASVMYGSDWVANGDGTYTAVRVRDIYSPLDRYLMGLLDSARLPPFTLLRNPAVDFTQLPVEGAVVVGTPETVTVDQVIAAEGPRSPGFALSQKVFRVGFIFLTQKTVDPTPEDLDAVERVRQAFAAQFFALTHGVAIADTTLAEAPT